MREPDPILEAARHSQLTNLPRRIYLTYRYHGIAAVARRALAFPLRFTPTARRLKLGRAMLERRARARRWCADHGRPATVLNVSPEDGDALVAAIERIQAGDDVVLLSADVLAEPGWRECLQYSVYGEGNDVGMVSGRLVDRAGRILHAGVELRAAAVPQFGARFRGAPADHGPADVPVPVLGASGACMYVRRDLIDRVGLPDPQLAPGPREIDWCLRAWRAGYRVGYEPGAIVRTLRPERGDGFDVPSSRELLERRWGPFFSQRSLRADGDRLRIVYVTEGTGVWGGHRVVFEDINSLRERGHDVSLYSLEAPPDWFELRAPVRTFPGYDELATALAPLDAIKVATWWKTAPHVWRASVVHGVPVYFVQDIETAYYPDGEATRHEVLATYRSEFHYLTTSSWNRDRLRELGHEAALHPPAVDLAVFRPLPRPRREDMLLAIGRAEPLKRLQLTIDAWRELPAPRPELCLFGSHPEIAPPDSRYVRSPTDAEVNELLNECTTFVQTSSHEGFSLPPLEAMATGAAVVCTDAGGNRDYCRDGVNCLMAAGDAPSVAGAIARLLEDPPLRAALGAEGIATAQDHGLERRAQALQEFFAGIAASYRA